MPTNADWPFRERCTRCNGDGEIPDPNPRHDARTLDGLATIECPQCRGHGWYEPTEA
jgi:hypothetical protein